MNKAKIGAVVLSRFSSSRLPGKALMKIDNKAVLEYIIERLLTVLERDEIVIATSNQETDLPIYLFAQQMNIDCFRGSLENVSERFFNATNAKEWDYAIRINGDNIFVDTELLKQMIGIANANSYEFISNVKNRTFPKGMSIEIVRASLYKKMLPAITASEYHSEHVTSYLYENEHLVNHCYLRNELLEEAAGLQFALDTQEDFNRTVKIIQNFEQSHTHYNLKEIFQIYKSLNL